MSGGGQLTPQNTVQKNTSLPFLCPLFLNDLSRLEFTKITSQGRWRCTEKNQLVWNFQQDNQESLGLACSSRELGVSVSLNAQQMCLLLPSATERGIQLMLTPQVSGPASSWPSAHSRCLYESFTRFGEGPDLGDPEFYCKNFYITCELAPVGRDRPGDLQEWVAWPGKKVYSGVRSLM